MRGNNSERQPNASALNEAHTCRKEAVFFNCLGPEIRENLEEEARINMMNQMARPGSARGRIHPVNPVHPVCRPDENEIIGKFGGADQLRDDTKQLQALLYAMCEDFKPTDRM